MGGCLHERKEGSGYIFLVEFFIGTLGEEFFGLLQWEVDVFKGEIGN